MGTILVIGGNIHSLVHFRGDMIKKMLSEGHKVFAMAPETDLEGEKDALMTHSVSDKLQAIGVPYFPIPLNRTGVNPLRDLYSLVYLIWKIHELKPEVVLSYTMKPAIYGSVAARIAGVRNTFSMITGLGYVFMGVTWRQKMLCKIVSFLYRIALGFNQKVYFMNPDDLELFVKRKILSGTEKAVLINGSGVNVDHFYLAEPRTDKVVFLIIARLLWDKGVREYVDAARIVKKKYPTACWKIVGPYDNNPSAVSRSDILRWQQEEIIEYMGATEDVRSYIAESSVYVLPSYREGTPRSVLEAMSMGRPVITTDAPGCRETVVDTVNGFLVPVKDSESLAKAMEKFIQNKDLIVTMGAKSREIAEERYDVNKVNLSILQTLDLKVAGKEKSESRIGELTEYETHI